MRPSHEPHARRPLRLLTLGGASLVDSGGAVILEQRRRLALLVLIATGRATGVSRDKLVLLLNPDSPTESARHALHQLLYYVRQQAGEDVLLGTDPLRLNPDVLTCDVVDFERAMDAGAFAEAAALYRGPFLDGFHLGDSPEFEELAASERTRLAARHMEALARLAGAAEAAGDIPAALVAWRRLAILDPLDGRIAASLMRALAGSGDRHGAIRHAEIHESLVRAELGADVDAEVAELAMRLRRGGGGVRPGPAGQGSAESVPIAVPSVPPAGAPVSASLPLKRWSMVSGALGAALVIALAAAAGLRPGSDDPPPDRGGVAIMPFRMTGTDSSARWMREGLVELLAIRLGDSGGPGAVDARRSIAAWASAGGSSDRDPPAAEVLDGARRLGAAWMVTGAVIGSGGEIRLVAELIDLGSGRPAARIEARGPVDSILRLVDTVAVRLVSIQGGEDMLRAGVLGASSVPAVRAYLEGRAALQRGDWLLAARQFDLALEADSTFASAALGLRMASGLTDGARRPHAEALAWRHRDRLGPRERAIFLAELGAQYPAWYPIADRLRAWRALVSSEYTDADAWTQLGLIYYHSGARLGVSDPLGEARLALERAFELDSSNALLARLQLIPIAAVSGDAVLLERVLRRAAAQGADTTSARWLRAFTRRDSAALRIARGDMHRMSLADLTTVWLLTQRTGYDVADANRAESIAVARARSQRERSTAASLSYGLALNQGRPALAQRAAPGIALEWRPLSRVSLYALNALYTDGDSAAGAAAAAALATEVARPLADDAAELRSQRIHVCISAQWSLAHGDTRPIDAVLRKLRAPEEGAVGAIQSFYDTCAAAIDAWRAVLEQRPNARALAERLDSLILTGPASHWAMPYHRVVARVWEAHGEPGRALSAIRRRSHDSVQHLGGDLGEEGRLALLAGDTAGVLAAWGHYLALRTAPEAPLRSKVDSVRRRLAGFRRGY